MWFYTEKDVLLTASASFFMRHAVRCMGDTKTPRSTVIIAANRQLTGLIAPLLSDLCRKYIRYVRFLKPFEQAVDSLGKKTYISPV